MHQLRDSCVSSEWAPACWVRRMGRSLLVLSHEFDDVEKISARYEEFPNQQRHASQTSGWFGQIIQRSDDGGKTWNAPGSSAEEQKSPDGMPKGESNKFVYDTSPETGRPLTTHQWYDGTQHPWEFKRVWHLEPSLDDHDTVYAGE